MLNILQQPNFWSLIIIILVVSTGDVLASEWSISSGIQLRNQYDDNPSLTTVSGDSVSSVSLIPSINFNRYTDITQNIITARLQSTRYSDDTNRDSDVQYIRFKNKTKGQRSTFNLNGEYRLDTTLASLVDIESIDDNLNTDDDIEDDDSDSDLGLINVSVDRSTFSISPKWSYKMSQSYSLNLNYRFNRRDYRNETGTGLVEYEQNNFGVGLTSVLNTKDLISYTVNLSEFEPVGGLKSEDSSVDFTYRRKISRQSNVLFLLGIRKTDTPTISSDGSIYKITYSNYYEISSLNVTLSQNITGSSTGNLVEKNQFDFSYRRRLSLLSNLYVRARTFENKSVENISSDRRYMSGELGARYTLSRKFSINMSYRYRYEKINNTGLSADGNAIFFGVSYSFNKVSTRF